MDTVLNFAIWLPLAGALLIWASAGFGRHFARMTALMFSIATFVLATWLIVEFPSNGEVQRGFAVTDVVGAR
jgi:NADH:ubiquinone oxidoreductase subunit 4 (subunit M)